MAVTLVTTPGSATANSYVTLAEVDAYLLAHPEWEEWDKKDTVDKYRLMIMATRQIDQLPICGDKLTEGVTTAGALLQALKFPRVDDVFSGSSFIPVAVKNATAQQCLWLITAGYGDWGARRKRMAEGVTSVTIGDVSETYDIARSKEWLSEAAYRILCDAGLLELSMGWM